MASTRQYHLLTADDAAAIIAKVGARGPAKPEVSRARVLSDLNRIVQDLNPPLTQAERYITSSEEKKAFEALLKAAETLEDNHEFVGRLFTHHTPFLQQPLFDGSLYAGLQRRFPECFDSDGDFRAVVFDDKLFFVVWALRRVIENTLEEHFPSPSTGGRRQSIEKHHRKTAIFKLAAIFEHRFGRSPRKPAYSDARGCYGGPFFRFCKSFFSRTGWPIADRTLASSVSDGVAWYRKWRKNRV